MLRDQLAHVGCHRLKDGGHPAAKATKGVACKVLGLATQPRAEPKEAEQGVGWVGHDVFQVACHHEAVIEGLTP